MPSSTQSEISKGALPVKKLVELITIDPANLKNNKPQSGQARLDTRILLVLAAITFCIGVAATLVWQSRGDAARKTIASAFSRLGWLAPQVAPVAQSAPDTFAPVASAAPSPDQQPTAPPLDLDAVRQSVDQIACRSRADDTQCRADRRQSRTDGANGRSAHREPGTADA
jgi:hypothetical protein